MSGRRLGARRLRRRRLCRRGRKGRRPCRKRRCELLRRWRWRRCKGRSRRWWLRRGGKWRGHCLRRQWSGRRPRMRRQRSRGRLHRRWARWRRRGRRGRRRRRRGGLGHRRMRRNSHRILAHAFLHRTGIEHHRFFFGNVIDWLAEFLLRLIHRRAAIDAKLDARSILVSANRAFYFHDGAILEPEMDSSDPERLPSFATLPPPRRIVKRSSGSIPPIQQTNAGGRWVCREGSRM